MKHDAVQSLHELRELAERHGIPLDVAESFALPYARAARLLGVSLRTIETLVAKGELAVVVVGENSPRIETVELLRYMDRMPFGGEPAYRFVCAIAPAPHDPRFFLLRPLLFQTRSAKTKVSIAGEIITSKIDLTVSGLWIDQKQGVHQETIAQTSWKISGYDIKTMRPRYFYEYETHGDAASAQVANHTAGWFVGIPLSCKHMPDQAPTLAARGEPFKLTVLVTERDESKAASYIERTSELLGENRQRFVEYVEAQVDSGGN